MFHVKIIIFNAGKIIEVNMLTRNVMICHYRNRRKNDLLLSNISMNCKQY
jgi:hypothetical protein